VADLHDQILQAPRRAHAPGAVAEMLTQLAQDRDDRERRERAAFGVVSVDGLDQAQTGHLLQVRERLTPSAVAVGEPMGKRQAQLHELRPSGRFLCGAFAVPRSLLVEVQLGSVLFRVHHRLLVAEA
jgi:hypothetical protein